MLSNTNTWKALATDYRASGLVRRPKAFIEIPLVLVALSHPITHPRVPENVSAIICRD
jgi:hypothetical protein